MAHSPNTPHQNNGGHRPAQRRVPQDATRAVSSTNKKPPNKPPNKKTNSRIIWANIFKTLFVLACIGVMVASIVMVGVVKFVVDSTKDDDYLLDLVAIKTPKTGYVWVTDPVSGERYVYQKLVGTNNTIWVDLSEMPEYIKQAVIATEDKDFYKHGGVSIGRTIYAGFNEIFHFTRTFGASTIDQQLVKNLTGDKDVAGGAGYQRKLREMFRAWSINKAYTKDQILEAYLNTLPLSGNIVGIEAGAREYFDKHASELTLAESALMAGITNAPGKYNPYTNPENALNRRNNVLLFMYKDKVITQAEYEEAKNQPLGLHEGPRQLAPAIVGSNINSYFSDALMEAVVQDLQDKGIVSSRDAAIQMYYNGGLQIEATMNPTVQAEMERIYTLGYGEGGLFPASVTAETEVTAADGTKTTQTVHPESAMIVMEYDGRIAGVVGGLGEKTASLVLNRATQSPRPIGSTMKPIGPYALGIEYGVINYSSLELDAPFMSRDPSNPKRDPETGEIVPDWPTNYGNTFSNQPVVLSDALARSMNTVAVRVGDAVGVDTMYSFLEDSLQITTLVESGSVNDKSLAPLVLGSLSKGITAQELAAAYMMFGNGGTYYKPYLYEKVTDQDGNIILQQEKESGRPISAETAFIMNRLMSNVLRQQGGTANGMAPSYMDSVAKTGTTTDDKDRWFVGLTPYYVSAVWWGYDTNEQIQFSPSPATNPPPLVWKTVMEAVQADLPEKSFPAQPEGVVEKTFCRDSGELAGPNCPNTQTGYYSTSFIPEECTLHNE